MTEISPNGDQDAGSPRQMSQEWLHRGIDLARHQHYEEALVAYEQALRLDPNDARIYMNKGTALYKSGRHEEALAAYDQASHLDPNDVRIYVNKGVILGQLGQYEEALAAYEQALHLSPNDARIYVNKGTALDESGHYEEALAAYDQALQLQSVDGLSWYNKGNTLLHLERYTEALAAYEQALRLDPNDARFYGNKGEVLDELGQPEGALAAYEQALHLDPRYIPALVSKGAVLSELGRHEEALVAYEQALHLNPNRAVIWGNKGNRLFELKRYEEALAAYEQALFLAPEDVNAASGRKGALEKLGRDEKQQHRITTDLPFPKTFRSRLTGRSRFVALLILIGGIGLLGVAGILLRSIITPLFLNSAPLPLLVGKIVLFLLVFLLAGFFLRAYYLVKGSKITLTREGLLYNAVSFKIYAPWKSVRGIGSAKYGVPFGGLTLREPVVMDRKVREGIQQEIAVLELTRLMIAKDRFKQTCPFTHILPIEAVFPGENWLQGEFGSYLRQCAPQIFEHEQTT